MLDDDCAPPETDLGKCRSQRAPSVKRPLPCFRSGRGSEGEPPGPSQGCFHKAIESQYPLAVDNVARLRRVHPDKSPGELISYLKKVYLTAVPGSGGSAGLAAVAVRDKRAR